MIKLSLSKQVFLALCIGVALGVVFGPVCSLFAPIGKAYVMFIQMVILLYIPCSIVHGLGSTRPTVARQLLKKGWFFLLIAWGLVYTTIFLLSLLFPSGEIAYNGDQANRTLSHHFLNYLVPENPIYDLANNIVPAIAIFGIIIGIGLMHLTHKEPLISLLERINGTIEKILKGITLAAPIGILAITANIAGTIYPSDIKNFSLYILPLIVAVIALTFWILPALITSFVPITHREVLKEFRVPCLLTFLIGSPSIAIPFLNECVKRHAEKFQIQDKELHNTSQMIVPIAYTFTQIGNLLVLFFMIYLSFYFQRGFDIISKVLVTILTLPMSFGGPELSVNAVAFLTEKLGLPKTSMTLYDQSGIIAQNFQVLLSTASMVMFAILLLLAYYNRLRFNFTHLFKHFFPFFFLLIAVTLGVKSSLNKKMFESVSPETMTIKEAYPEALSAIVYKESSSIPKDHKRLSISDPIERIFKTRTLYVGYAPHHPPFSYFNDAGQLVGYNIAFAYKLAHDMHMQLVFIPFSEDNLGNSLIKNEFDIAMAPLFLSEVVSQKINFPHYYMATPNVFIVRKKEYKRFLNFKKLQENPKIVIGTPGSLGQMVKGVLPLAHFVSLKRPEDIDTYLSNGEVDAVMWTRELALGFCNKHANHVVVEYGSLPGMEFLAYPVKFDAYGFIFFLNRWLTIQQNIGFNEEQYNYWMLKQPPSPKAARWSLMRFFFGTQEGLSR